MSSPGGALKPWRLVRALLFLALAAYGARERLLFIAWVGFALAAAELTRGRYRQAAIASAAFFIGGLILIGEIAVSGSIDLWAALGFVAGLLLTIMGAQFLFRLRQRTRS